MRAGQRVSHNQVIVYTRAATSACSRCPGDYFLPFVRKQRALALCERAYACDPLHTGAKRRLSGWAPEKWKERIAKEV